MFLLCFSHLLKGNIGGSVELGYRLNKFLSSLIIPSSLSRAFFSQNSLSHSQTNPNTASFSPSFSPLSSFPFTAATAFPVVGEYRMRHTPFVEALLTAAPDPLGVQPTSLFTRTPFTHTTWYTPGTLLPFPLDYASYEHTEKRNEMDDANICKNQEERKNCADERGSNGPLQSSRNGCSAHSGDANSENSIHVIRDSTRYEESNEKKTQNQQHRNQTPFSSKKRPHFSHRYSSRYSFTLPNVESEPVSIPYHLLFASSFSSSLSSSSSSSISPTHQRGLLLAENVVLLTDGLCGSTCAVFALTAFHHRHARLVGCGGVWHNSSQTLPHSYIQERQKYRQEITTIHEQSKKEDNYIPAHYPSFTFPLQEKHANNFSAAPLMSAVSYPGGSVMQAETLASVFSSLPHPPLSPTSAYLSFTWQALLPLPASTPMWTRGSADLITSPHSFYTLNRKKVMRNETEEEINGKEASLHTELPEVEQTKLVSSEIASYDAQQIRDSEENSPSFPFIHIQKSQFVAPPLNHFGISSSLRRNHAKQNPLLHHTDSSSSLSPPSHLLSSPSNSLSSSSFSLPSHSKKHSSYKNKHAEEVLRVPLEFQRVAVQAAIPFWASEEDEEEQEQHFHPYSSEHSLLSSASTRYSSSSSSYSPLSSSYISRPPLLLQEASLVSPHFSRCFAGEISLAASSDCAPLIPHGIYGHPCNSSSGMWDMDACALALCEEGFFLTPEDTCAPIPLSAPHPPSHKSIPNLLHRLTNSKVTALLGVALSVMPLILVFI